MFKRNKSKRGNICAKNYEITQLMEMALDLFILSSGHGTVSLMPAFFCDPYSIFQAWSVVFLGFQSVLDSKLRLSSS